MTLRVYNLPLFCLEFMLTGIYSQNLLHAAASVERRDFFCGGACPQSLNSWTEICGSNIKHVLFCASISRTFKGCTQILKGIREPRNRCFNSEDKGGMPKEMTLICDNLSFPLGIEKSLA